MTSQTIALPADFPALLAAQGIDLHAWSTAVQLPQRALDSPLRLPLATFVAGWEALGRLDPDIGLRLGKTFGDRSDVLTLATLAARDLREALVVFSRYKRITCPEEVTVDERGDSAAIHVRWLGVDDLPDALVDATLAAVWAMACSGTGQTVAVQSISSRRPTRDAARRAHFGCAIGRGPDGLVLPRAALDLPFRARNDELLEIMRPGLEAAIALPSDDLVREVGHAIEKLLRGRKPTLADLARSLGMSARTLQRRLGELGHTYQSLLDHARVRIARELLSGDADIAEIAFVLGYDEVNSFSRVFQRHVGTTPLRWRTMIVRATA